MSQDTRKATDVLLALESKIESLVNIIRAQELNIKIISNKLNLLVDHMSTQNSQPAKAQPQIKIEATDIFNDNSNKNVKISAEGNLAVAKSSDGSRRVSREEAIKNAVNQVKKHSENDFSQVPQIKEDVFVAPTVLENKSCQVMQRVLDKNSKSIFLAEVEVKSADTGEVVLKTRTNGVGKWMGSLPAGNYRSTIRKQGASGKGKLEVTQDIKIDGRQSLLELQELVIK